MTQAPDQNSAFMALGVTEPDPRRSNDPSCANVRHAVHRHRPVHVLRVVQGVFLEAGKRRLAADTARAASTDEVPRNTFAA